MRGLERENVQLLVLSARPGITQCPVEKDVVVVKAHKGCHNPKDVIGIWLVCEIRVVIIVEGFSQKLVIMIRHYLNSEMSINIRIHITRLTAGLR